jgi:hypothetical protein
MSSSSTTKSSSTTNRPFSSSTTNRPFSSSTTNRPMVPSTTQAIVANPSTTLTLPFSTPTTTSSVTNIVKTDSLSYNLLVSQNKLLTDSIQVNKNKNTTNNQKYNYQSSDIDFLNKINNYLFLIYYFVILFVCYYLFYDKNITRTTKAFILFIFVIYPYVFNIIRQYLVKFLLYLYSIVNFTAYEYN